MSHVYVDLCLAGPRPWPTGWTVDSADDLLTKDAITDGDLVRVSEEKDSSAWGSGIILDAGWGGTPLRMVGTLATVAWISDATDFNITAEAFERWATTMERCCVASVYRHWCLCIPYRGGPDLR
jgi:hypothetical protein